MAIAGNPKKIAQDIADGFTSFSAPGLKKYTPADLKIILNNMAIVQREIRAIQVPQEDTLQIKAKNMRLSRLNQAEVVVRSFCKKMRIPV
ncbi:MAG: hypothetical protein GW875_15965 [Deltaproteobacteria bacterium]|nr:hypothetical protein [Deltaproteobacteria bacterium]NCP02137.1 hypothetical protein [Deltaproteobacteria bacterium]NCP77619.1 hypothetical protein [Desulfuromonadales bacterium]